MYISDHFIFILIIIDCVSAKTLSVYNVFFMVVI